MRPFRARRARQPSAVDPGQEDNRAALDGRHPRALHSGKHEPASLEADELRGLLRIHAREAERRRHELLGELEELKLVLRERIAEVAAREEELSEARRRLERRRGGRRRRSPADGLEEREAKLEARSRQLEAFAEELAKRERELLLREWQLGARESSD